MRLSHVLLSALLILTAACSQQTGGKSAGATSDDPPLGKLSDDVTPVAYRLDLTVDPEADTFEGAVQIDVNARRELSRIWLHGYDLTMETAYAALPDGTKVNASYEQADVTGVAKLTFENPVPAGDYTLHMTWSAAFSNSPDGLYHTQEAGLYYVASQLESISARKVFPGFDEPRFKTPYDITVTAKTGDVAITIAPELSTEDAYEGMTRHIFKTTKPVPAYLLAFAVGPYEINEWTPIPANSVRSEPLPLRGLAAKGKAGQMDYALKNTGEMVRLLEEYFDAPYAYEKLDIIAAPGFFGGAMENVAAIMYHEFIMLMDENSSINQRRVYEIVHAHELAHQWFGNYVTPVWWDDIWLNESFASWMEVKIAQEHWPEGEFGRSTLTGGLGAMTADSLANARQIRNDVASNAEIDDAFDTITYEKGGAVLAMFESYLGKEDFRAGVRTHMKRFGHKTATVDDFMQSMADGSGHPEVAPAIGSFIGQPGVPLVETSLDCTSSPVLKLRQSRYAPLGSAIDKKKTWQIPFCAAYGTEDGQATVCGLIDKKNVELDLGTASCPAYVVPNGDGSGYFRFALDEAGWQALAQASDSLTAEQALAYADSLNAAFRADAVSADALLDGIVALSKHDSWDVVSSAAGYYEGLIDLARDADTRAKMEAFGGQTFRPVYEALGNSDDAQTRLLRGVMTRFMAVVALDPEVRAGMLPSARAFVGMNGEPDPSAIPPDLLETVLSVGVQEDGEPFFDALLEMVRASTDPAFRGAAVGALARTEDTALTVRLLDATIGPEFSTQEAGAAINRQLARYKTQDVAWAWIVDHYDQIRQRAQGIAASRVIPGLGGSFCSDAQKADYKSFIEAHADDLPGYERTYAQTTEAIELCTALETARGEELTQAAASRI